MDMFMDKLAQKLTAQEIIKANTAADVEELNKLKNQIAEYNECLAKLQKLIDDGFAKLSGIRTGEDETARAVEENTERTKALQQETRELRKLIELQQERLDQAAAKRLATLEDQTKTLTEGLEARMETLAGGTETLSATVGEKIDQLCGQLEAQASAGMSERLDQLEENVHKECVKVYRNVQAVMVEESGKQGDALSEAKAAVTSVRGKLGAVLGVSVAAAVLSLVSLALQILSGLNIKLF